MRNKTKCLHAGYTPKNTEPKVVPIVQSTTYVYDSTEDVAAVFGETLANPALTVLDIERFANIAHRHTVPLIVDNTFATPVLCKPFEYGADIIVHSTSKYMDGHAVQIGGAIVDSGKFDWMCGKFPGLTEPDESF